MRKHVTPFTGTWKLNVAKSAFHQPSVTQSETVTWAPDGTFTGEWVGALGNTAQTSYPWSGGQEVPVTAQGIENATHCATIRGHTLDATTKLGGQTIQTLHAVVSPDGKSMTLTLDAIDPQGRPIHAVEIFEEAVAACRSEGSDRSSLLSARQSGFPL